MMYADRKGRWGWMFFDWATQPFHTLLLTFIFAPYFASTVIGNETEGQAIWGYTLTVTGLIIAFMSPFLGAMADASGPRKPWIAMFSGLIVAGSFGLWYAEPGMTSVLGILISFSVAFIGIEVAAAFVNAILPELVPRNEVGRLSGSGWAFGYAGGFVALILVLVLFAESDTGKTLIGIEPILGLDPATREGTRSVGPFSAIWFIVFMVPFFLWVPDVPKRDRRANAVREGLRELGTTLRALPANSSLSAFFLGSMFYRDALNALYAFGGIYAKGVLGWSITQLGVFGIATLVTGGIGAWIGGRLDQKYGPKPVVAWAIVALIVVVALMLSTSREMVVGVGVSPGSIAPDAMLYLAGVIIGAAGGITQAASRTLMVHQVDDPAKMTEAFGLYAFSGKATAFLAPLAIGITTDLTGSQRLGVSPLIALFAFGLILLYWVKTSQEAKT